MIDRIRGALFGLAAGDHIGGPLRMALTLARSLISQNGFDKDDLLARYVAWWQKEGFDTGRVAAQVFDLIADGVPPQTAVYRVHLALNGQTAGCNPAHRAVLLALFGGFPDTMLAEIAHEEAALTHYDQLAGDVAASVVQLCRALIYGGAISHSNPQPLNRGGFAPDVLNAALHFVTRHDDFESALVESIAFAGADNYCPVLVGALGGAKWGRNAIPDQLLRHCADILPDIYRTSEAFIKTWEM